MDMSDKSFALKYTISDELKYNKNENIQLYKMYIHSICTFMSFFTLLKIKWDEPGKLWDLWRLFITGPNFFMNKTKTKTNSTYNKRI